MVESLEIRKNVDKAFFLCSIQPIGSVRTCRLNIRYPPIDPAHR